MPSVDNTLKLTKDEKTRKLFSVLYGKNDDIIDTQVKRYTQAILKYSELFPDNCEHVQIFSSPGRTEIGGNHTDHNSGRVLAAGVNLDSIAVCSKNNRNIITIYSKGYARPFTVDLKLLDVQEDETGTTTAIMRGIANRFHELGYKIGGLVGYIDSNVMPGSGLSSSASIEVLLGTVLNYLYNDGNIPAEQIAIIGQYSENVYFGKPCGLMDQMACSVGGFVNIDFRDPQNPIVRKIDFDFAAQGYSLLVVDTGGNHADLTQDYAAVPIEMKSVAKALGGQVCRDISMEVLIPNIKKLRVEVGDRAILRAMHFFAEDRRVVDEVEALIKRDFDAFLKLVTSSGNSSWKWLQNCYPPGNPSEQGVTLALAITENFVKSKGKGAYRVHGGGFAGTIQVFIPNEFVQEYTSLMENIFEENCVTVLSVRPYGAIHINSLI